jgi:hypothetical protein
MARTCVEVLLTTWPYVRAARKIRTTAVQTSQKNSCQSSEKNRAHQPEPDVHRPAVSPETAMQHSPILPLGHVSSAAEREARAAKNARRSESLNAMLEIEPEPEGWVGVLCS